MNEEIKEKRFEITLKDNRTGLSMNYEASSQHKLSKFFKTFLKNSKRL